MSIHHDKIVIGSSLQALMYAANNNLNVLFTTSEPPFEFDYLSPEFDGFGMRSDRDISLKCEDKLVLVGQAKAQLWQKLMFSLSLSGRILFADLARSLTVDDNKLFVSCSGMPRKTINFEKLIIFDDRNIVGLPELLKQQKDTNIVYDWVNVTSGGRHEYDVLIRDEDFINQVYFYPSRRTNNTKLKDLVAISYLTDEQVADFSYSDTYVKFKLLDVFKELGIRGARNGRDVNNPEKYKYYAAKLEPASRIIKPRVLNTYEDDDRFEFNNQSFEEILEQKQHPKGYLKTVLDNL